MKRYLLMALGMVLLGTAGLLVLHQVVEFPSPAKAQSAGAPAAAPGAPAPAGPSRPPAEPGQYKDVVPALLDALADADGSVRQLAAATLIKIGPDTVPALVVALTTKDAARRANVAYVLGQLGEPAQEALPALAKALKDDDAEVRRRAAYALHNIVRGNEEESAGGGAPLPRLGPRAMPGGGPPARAMQAPLDPGLLVPETNAPGRHPKEPK
jgi:hypothetical protein